MRTNTFGEHYCHTVEEARRCIDENDDGWEVYVTEFSPPEGPWKASAEIRTNRDGELVCYLEADTEALVRAMADELKLEKTWGTS